MKKYLKKNTYVINSLDIITNKGFDGKVRLLINIVGKVNENIGFM